eukprot:3941980-Rhodomonas_salina.8
MLTSVVSDVWLNAAQQSQQTSVDISAAVSRQISEQLPDEEDEVGSIVFEDDNMWKVTGYVDCKEVIVHVDSEEHSVSIRDCTSCSPVFCQLMH